MHLQDNAQRPLFGRFIGSLAKMTQDSQPTIFHELLKHLQDRGSLVRTYTQNIDGLELKAGLSTYHRMLTQEDHRPFRCIPLHGCLQYMYCQSCHAVEDMASHQDELLAGRFPSCSACKRGQEARKEAGKRLQAVPQLVPDVVLYGQEHPDSDRIAEFHTQDLSGKQMIDLLLVVGTGIHIVGTQRMVREFAQLVRKNSLPSDTSPRTIYLNLDFKQRKKWESTFDLWVQADCQAVAHAVLTAFQSEKSQQNLLQPLNDDPDKVQ